MLGGIAVGQVVLAAMPRGSPAAPRRQVNAPLARTNDLPYHFSRPPILSRTLARPSASKSAAMHLNSS